jgi:hypothetical protein
MNEPNFEELGKIAADASRESLEGPDVTRWQSDPPYIERANAAAAKAVYEATK